MPKKIKEKKENLDKGLPKTEIDQFILNEEVKGELIKLNDNFKELKKSLGSIQESINLVYNDRDLLKDIVDQIGGLKNIVLALDKHNENLTQDLKKEVIDTGSKVEQSAEEVKDTVDYKTDQLKEHVGEIKGMKTRMIKGKSIIRKFFNLLNRLKNWKAR